MEVRGAKKISIYDRLGGQQPVKNQVCTYWLAGRCNRNPCRFMHRESPPPQTKQSHLKHNGKMIWRNPDRDIPKSRHTSSLSSKADMPNSTSYQKTQQNTGAKSGYKGKHVVIRSTSSDYDIQTNPKVLTVVRSEPDETSSQKSQPKQCKYWVTGNCVNGEKCKDVHSWFSGSGFTVLTKLEGHTKAITGISLPSGCDKLYSGSQDRSIRAWDCNSGQLAGSLSTDGEVGCLISEDAWVFVGLPNVVKAWNLQNQAELTLNVSTGLVRSMVVDDDKLFAGTEDGTILVWKLHAETAIPEPVAMLKGHEGAVCSLVIGANRLYSGSKDCTIKVWDLQNLRCLQTLRGHTRDVMSILCWDKFLLSASLDKTLKVWSATESGTIEVIYEIKDDYEVIALCGILDAEGKPILLCSYSDNAVRLYDLPSFSERGRIFSKRRVQVIQIGTGGQFFTGDATGELSVWNLLDAPIATATSS